MDKFYNILAKSLQVFIMVCMLSLVFEMGTATAQEPTDPFSGTTNSTVFKSTSRFLGTTYNAVRQIVYVLAGIAAIGLGVMAMMGRFAWGKFFGIIAGIGVIALIENGVYYMTQVNIDTVGSGTLVE